MPGTVRGPLKRKRDALDSPPIMNPSVAGTNSHHHHRIMQPGETQPAQKKPRLTGRVPDTPFGAQFGPRKLTVNEFLQSPNYWPPLGGRQRNPRLSSHKSVSSTAIAPITGNSVGSAGPLRLDRGQQHRSAGDSTRLPSSLNAYWYKDHAQSDPMPKSRRSLHCPRYEGIELSRKHCLRTASSVCSTNGAQRGPMSTSSSRLGRALCSSIFRKLRLRTTTS